MSVTRDPPKILVADDDEGFLEAIELWLREYDSPEVITVTNGADATAALDSTINVFLCDRQMPELTGVEVIERMKHEGPNVPTIIISAYAPDSYLREEDVEYYLQKPITSEDLYRALDAVLDR